MTKATLRIGILAITLVAAFTQVSRAQTWEIINANVPGAVTGGNNRPIDSDGTRLYVLGDRGVYVSSDNGDSFTPINDVAGTTAYTLTNLNHRFVKYVNGYVWIGSDPGSGAINLGHASVHRLTPGQTVWEKSSNGFPVGDTGNQADDIAYDASTGTYYVAAALGGAFVSSNGTDWEQRTTGLGGLGLPASVVAFNGMAFELRPLAQVHKTTNRGTNWTALVSHQGISSGYLLEMNGRIMFSTSGNNTLQDGFYYSDDFGATWNFLFSNALKLKCDLTKAGGLIYAAGTAGGVYASVYGQTGFKFSATQGLTWDTLPTNGLAIDYLYGFTANRIVRQGNYLFMHSYTNLYRCDVSGFDFTPTTQIVRQPITSTNRLVGQPFTLDVLAGGTNLTYQWRLNDTNIDGATSASFAIASAQTNDSGPYTVVVTGDRGSVTSAVSTVTVVAPVEGKVDITYNSPKTGGQLVRLPDGSLISVSGANIYRYSPDGVLLTNRNVSGMNFTAVFLDSSNRLLLVNSSGVNSLRRFNDGDLTDDETFTPPTVNTTLYSATELPGRGYLLAGNFSSVTNVGVSTNALSGICLVNYSGIVDTNFNAGPSPGGPTRVVVDAGTNIYATGFWTFWNGEYETKGFVKLNLDGTRDTNFTSFSLDSSRFLQPLISGKLLALDNNRRLVLMNLDGTLDNSFNPAHYSVNNTISAVVPGESGKLYVAGLFSSYGGTSVGKYMRLFSDGTLDTNFDSTVGPTSQGFSSAAYDPNGYLYLVRNYSSGCFKGRLTVTDLIAYSPEPKPPMPRALILGQSNTHFHPARMASRMTPMETAYQTSLNTTLGAIRRVPRPVVRPSLPA